MTSTRRGWLLGLAVLFLGGCAGFWGAPHGGVEAPAVGVRTLEETVDGHRREALLFVPDGVEEPAPLVLVIHGSKDSPEEFLGYWRESLATRGWVGVFPATGHAGKPVLDGSGDTPFMMRLVDRVGEELAIDPDRIYVAGFSGGARETYQVAAHHGDRFAAIGAAGGVIAYADDPPERSDPRVHGIGPLSVVHIHGKRDPKVNLEGGVHRAADGSEHRMLPALEGMQHWIELDAAVEQPRAPASYGPERLNVRRWTGPSGAGVMMVVDPELDHSWPPYGAELMCRFFEQR
jgi:polyhydroxybutyrate depolymerase